MRDASRPPIALHSPGADISEPELERARAAYRGSLEATRAQRAFLPSVRHEDTACWSMLGSLFVEPGMNRTVLVGRISQYAGVSRATAERVVRRAREGGHIVDQPSGRMVRYFLSQRSFDCCIEYFRKYMGQDKASEHSWKPLPFQA